MGDRFLPCTELTEAQQWAGTSKVKVGLVIGRNRYRDLVRTLNTMKVHYMLESVESNEYYVRVLMQDAHGTEQKIREWRERTTLK